MSVVKAINTRAKSSAALSNTLDYIYKDKKVTEELKLVTGDYFEDKDVHEALTNAITLQIGKVFINRKEEALLKATRRENELLKLKIISLEKNIETLTAELKKKSSSEFDLVNNL